MSTPADVPQEVLIDAQLAEDLERHGVHLHPGDRVRLQLVTDRESGGDDLWGAFIGSESEEPDLGERSEEILRAEFGRQ